jgi:low temperature requirement protein LtrA
MKGIALPERTEDFTTDPVELFFDLAYVFAFSQLVGILIDDPTWSGVGRVALLFGLLWLPWQEFTWSANAVSGNGRPIRLVFLVATVVSVPMAAATSSAMAAGGVIFAASLTAIMTLGFAVQLMSGSRGTDFHRAVTRWVLPNTLAVALLIGGAAVDGAARVTLWLLSLAVVLVAMVLAGSGAWIVRFGHMAERHGLIVIVALGEVIVAIGIPVVAALQAGNGMPTATLLALLAAGAFACLLWWGYFDRMSPALEHRAGGLGGDVERGRYTRDVYTWAHAPVVAGIILAAAAIEEIALHPSDPVHTPFRMMLVGGLTLVMAGFVAAVWRAHRRLAVERVLTAVAIGAVVTMAAPADGVVVLGLVVLIMLVALVTEHVRAER